jgi:hypothetical protein
LSSCSSGKILNKPRIHRETGSKRGGCSRPALSWPDFGSYKGVVVRVILEDPKVYLRGKFASFPISMGLNLRLFRYGATATIK